MVLITSGEAGNFGSFLYRDITKLVNLAEMPAHWRFLAYVDNPVFEQFLELAGLPMERLIRHDPRAIYHIEQAIIPGLRSPYALADPETRALYGRLRKRCDTGVRGARLYVSRHSVSSGKPSGRMMLNEAELIGRLRRLGFAIVEPQYMSASQQNRDLCVGRAGGRAIRIGDVQFGLLSSGEPADRHRIGAALDLPALRPVCLGRLRYGIFEGKAEDRDFTVHHKPWRVNIDALLRRIDTFA